MTMPAKIPASAVRRDAKHAAHGGGAAQRGCVIVEPEQQGGLSHRVIEEVVHSDEAAAPDARDAGLRASRLRLVRDEDWAQDTQRRIREDDVTAEPDPERVERLYLLSLSRHPRDLPEMLYAHEG